MRPVVPLQAHTARGRIGNRPRRPATPRALGPATAWGLLAVSCLILWAAAGSAERPNWERDTSAGLAAYERGQYAEARRKFLAALRGAEASRRDDRRLVTSLTNLADLYLTLHQYADAEPLLRQAIALQKQLAGPRHPSVAAMLEDYATLLRETNREAELAAVEARIRVIRADPAIQAPSAVWVKPGAAPADFDRDDEGCLREARYGATRYGPLIDPELYTRCLKQRGWRTQR
ncbi:MAG: tetratricopeptide repeat protein [Candidatus Rokubacteria bacterium]|nr:tetratricopeptide repeat protein [Candidatus Rokubacteria bacterium]